MQPEAWKRVYQNEIDGVDSRGGMGQNPGHGRVWRAGGGRAYAAEFCGTLRR